MLFDAFHTGLLLLLHIVLVVAQDDAGAGDAYIGQVQEQDDAGDVGQLSVGCEEGLEYMRFLRKVIRLV